MRAKCHPRRQRAYSGYKKSAKCWPCYREYRRELYRRNAKKKRRYHKLWRMKQGESWKAYQRNWKRKNYAKIRPQILRRYRSMPVEKRIDDRLRRTYGITRQAQLELWKQQKKRCALCRKPLRKQDIQTDHDHKRGIVRGLLHKHCNAMLGHVEKWGLKKVQKYINRR